MSIDLSSDMLASDGHPTGTGIGLEPFSMDGAAALHVLDIGLYIGFSALQYHSDNDKEKNTLDVKRSDDELTSISPVVRFFTLLHLFFRPLVPSSLLLLSTPLSPCLFCFGSILF